MRGIVSGLSHGGHPGLCLRVGGVSGQVHGDHITEVTSGPSASTVHARACRPTRGLALRFYRGVCWLYLSCLQANVRNMSISDIKSLKTTSTGVQLKETRIKFTSFSKIRTTFICVKCHFYSRYFVDDL